MDSYPPHTRKTVETLGFPTSYYEAGDPRQRTLILLHGMSASADSFRETMHVLSDDFHLLAPDIPGFGYSGDIEPYTFPRLLAWLAAFYEAHSVEQATLIGHSFGGALEVTFALDQPERVHCLILLAPSILRPGKYPEWLRNLGKSELFQRVLELGIGASRLIPERQNRAAFYDPDRFPQELWRRRARDYEMSRASAAVLRASALHDIRSELHRISQPTCIIWGEDDPVLDPADAHRLDALMPQSNTRLFMLPACGHLPQVEQVETVVAIIRECLENRH
jgi:pimeloyl-ACP methyl ester carboxylesterase